jgi:hypothetical protein
MAREKEHERMLRKNALEIRTMELRDASRKDVFATRVCLSPDSVLRLNSIK